MSDNLIQSQFSKVNPESMFGKIIQFPLCRLLIAIIFLAVPSYSLMFFDQQVFPSISENLQPIIADLKSLLYFILLIVFYKLYVKVVEKRQPSEMSFNGGIKETMMGIAIGAGLLLAVVSTIAILGYYKVDTYTGNYLPILHGLFTFGTAAFIEEILFRLILFKLTEELLGSWWTMVIQAVLFGLMHAGNPSANWVSSLSIMLSAGLLLTVIYMYTRRVWLILGLHFIWNYLQASVFGIPVSGHQVEGLMESSLSGPEILSGGAFGVEASIFTVIFCMIVWAFYMNKVITENKYIQPKWSRVKFVIESKE